jgi:hypothetical protein
LAVLSEVGQGLLAAVELGAGGHGHVGVVAVFAVPPIGAARYAIVGGEAAGVAVGRERVEVVVNLYDDVAAAATIAAIRRRATYFRA